MVLQQLLQTIDKVRTVPVGMQVHMSQSPMYFTIRMACASNAGVKNLKKGGEVSKDRH